MQKFTLKTLLPLSAATTQTAYINQESKAFIMNWLWLLCSQWDSHAGVV